MITALTLLFAGQEAATPPKPTFEEILAAANKSWYELPQATTTLKVVQEDAEKADMVEARDGDRYVLRMTFGGKLQLDSRSDGTREVSVIPERQTYIVATAKPRKAWGSDEKSDPKPQEPDTFQLQLNKDVGLILRVAGKELTVTSNAPGKLQGRDVRFVSAELIGREIEGKGRNTIKFGATIDAEKGYIARARIVVTDHEETSDTTTAIWTCVPTVRNDHTYTTDTSQFEGWVKIDGDGR